MYFTSLKSTKSTRYHPQTAHASLTMNTRSVLGIAAHYARTAYFFSKADIQTILIPITAFAWASAPVTSISRLAHALLWTWLHLLQFDMSNQALSPAEDAENKPFRPIPAGLITVEETKTIRWVFLPICLAVSVYYDVLPTGLAFALGTIAYNEMKLDSHWFSKNILNALLYGAFDAGATAIASHGLGGNDATSAAPYFNALIILTTVHAQDFRDEIGDRLEKRLTIPIVMPSLGRASMPVGLTLWSLFLGFRWTMSPILFAVLALTGMFVGVRFYVLRSPEEDRKSYRFYNIWLVMARIIPVLV